MVYHKSSLSFGGFYMKKIVLFAVCLTLIGVVFVSATGSRSSASSGGAKTIKVWTNNAHSRPEIVAAVEKYNATESPRSGIIIDYTVHGSDYYTVLDLAIAAGEEPYIYKITGSLPRLMQEGAIIPLTELPAWFRDSVLKDYEPYHISGQSIFNGVPYTINWAVSGYSSLGYNVPLLRQAGFSEPPKTWAEFEQMCIAVPRVRPGQTFGTYMPLRYANYPSTYLGGTLAPSYGKFFFDFTTGKYCYSDFVEYFEMYQRIINAGAMFPGMENLDDDTARAQFAEGNILFILVNPSFNVGVLYDQFPAKMEWKIAPVPVKDPNNRFNVMGTTATNLVVSKKARDERLLEEVARVYAYFISDEVAGSLYTNGKDLPINPRVVQSAPPSTRVQWNDIATLAAGSVLRPNHPDTMFSVEGDDINASFARILTGGNARDILADMDRRFNAAFDRAVSQGVINRADYIKPEIEQQFRRR
jgi:ABC-type glycerol-3-phosphate transport system substrate-binding protein